MDEFTEETTNVWSELQRSFENFFQNMVDHAPRIVIGVLLFIFFWGLAFVLRRIFTRFWASRADDPLLLKFIGNIIFWVVLLAGLSLFLKQVGLGDLAGGLVAGAGVSAIVIGFAFKDVGENFLSGIFLAFRRPFRIGDIITITDISGKVVGLDLRITHMRTFEGKDVFIPNSIIFKNPLFNHTKDGLMRFDFGFGLDYGDDVRGALDKVQAFLNQNETISQRENIKPFVIIEEFGTSTINFRIFFWIEDYHFPYKARLTRTRLMEDLLLLLVKEGFNLPADIVELKIYQKDNPIPIEVHNFKTSA